MALVASITACAGLPEVHPHVLDTQLGEMREYEVINDDADVRYKVNHPMTWGRDTYGNGFWCIPPKEAAALKSWYLKNKKSK